MSSTVERNSRVTMFVNQDDLQVAFEKSEARVLRLEKSLQKLKDAGKSNTVEFSSLNDKLSAAKSKSEEYANLLSGKFTTSIKDAEKSTQKLGNEIRNWRGSKEELDDKIKQFQNMNTELAKMKNEAGLVGNSLKKAANESTTAWAKWKDIAIGTFIGNTVQSAIQTIGSWISNIGTLRNQFESTLGNLSAITGATGKDLEYLRNQALQLGMQGKTSATEWLEAFKLVGSAKPELLANGAALVEVTRAAKLLSAASGMELKSAVESLTDTLNQYGAEADQAKVFTDALAAGAKYGAAEVGDVSAAIKEFGTQAKSANISIFESVGAVELMAEKGLKGAEAGTKLRNVMLAMSAVKGLDKQALDSLAQYGVNTDLLQDKSKSLQERLTELSKIQNDNAALVKVFGKENFNAGQIILQNIPRYAQLTDQVKEQGVASEQAKANTANFGNAMSKLGNVLETLIVSMKTPEVFTEWANGLSDLLSKFGKLTGLIDDSNDAVDAFRKKAAEVASLEKNMNPLLARYDELRNKTSLSKDEQIELNKVINSIAQAIPGAVTEWDKYGNAIGISSTKAKEFIELQKLILKVKNEDAIKETEKQIKKEEEAQRIYNNQLEKSQNLLAKYQNQVSSFSKRYSPDELKKMLQNPDSAEGSSTGSYSQAAARVELYAKELDRLSTSANESREKLQGLKGIVSELKGDNLSVPTSSSKTENANTNSSSIVSTSSNDSVKAMEELKKKYADYRLDILAIGGNADENELVKLQQKFAALLEEGEIYHKKGLSGDEEYESQRARIMEQWRNEISAIDAKHESDKLKKEAEVLAEQKRLREQFLQGTHAEYEQAKLDFSEYINTKKSNLEADYLNGTISKKEFDNGIRNIDEESKRGLLQIAMDYAANDKQAATDTAKAKSDLIKAEVDNVALAERRKLELKLAAGKAAIDGMAQITDAFFARQESKANIATKKAVADEERKKKSLDERLKNSTISQTQYDKELEKIESGRRKREAQAAHDQAVMQKKQALFNAGIQLAQAIMSILAQYPKFDGGIMMGIALGAAGLAFGVQVAKIQSMEVPPVAGYAVGTENAPPGWAWVGEQGPELMQMKGGERIKTNADSMRMMASLPKINYGAVTQAMQTNRMALAGGDSFFSSGRADAFFNGQESSIQMLAAIHQELKKPNRSYVVYSDIKDKERNINNVKQLSGAK